MLSLQLSCNSTFGPKLIDYFLKLPSKVIHFTHNAPSLPILIFLFPTILYSPGSPFYFRLPALPVFPPGLLQRSQHQPYFPSVHPLLIHTICSSGPLLSCLHFWIPDYFLNCRGLYSLQSSFSCTLI